MYNKPLLPPSFYSRANEGNGTDPPHINQQPRLPTQTTQATPSINSQAERSPSPTVTTPLLVPEQTITVQPTGCPFTPGDWFTELLAKCPSNMTREQWQTCCMNVYKFLIAPVAAISGFQGGMQAGEQIFHAPKPIACFFGIGGFFSFWTNFGSSSIPDLPSSKLEFICNGINAALGAVASGALNQSSTLHSCYFLKHVTREWLSYFSGATSGVAECIFGFDKGSQWVQNFKAFYAKLCGHDLNNQEKVLLVLCGLIIAYLAATTMVGYAPSVIKLIASFAPQWIAETCGVLTNVAEWMFATNLMFSLERKDACCWHFKSPLPDGINEDGSLKPDHWRNNKIASVFSLFVATMGGLSTAGFTFAALSNPILAYCLAATAWTGGFWMGGEPTFTCCAKPTVDYTYSIWERCFRSYLC